MRRYIGWLKNLDINRSLLNPRTQVFVCCSQILFGIVDKQGVLQCTQLVSSLLWLAFVPLFHVLSSRTLEAYLISNVMWLARSVSSSRSCFRFLASSNSSHPIRCGTACSISSSSRHWRRSSISLTLRPWLSSMPQIIDKMDSSWITE